MPPPSWPNMCSASYSSNVLSRRYSLEAHWCTLASLLQEGVLHVSYFPSAWAWGICLVVELTQRVGCRYRWRVAKVDRLQVAWTKVPTLQECDGRAVAPDG